MSDGDSSCSEEDVYEVEEIVDHLEVEAGKEPYYRVRWKGYDVNADTWEPRDNLLSCEDLLNAYIAKHVKKRHVGDDKLSSDDEVGQTIFKKGISKKNTGQKTKSNKSNLSGKKISKGRGRGKGGTAAKGKWSRRVSSSTSDSIDSDAEEEPRVKDPFWEDLKEGRIDVLSGDLYSKVKRRRDPADHSIVTKDELPGKEHGQKRTAEKNQKGANVSHDSGRKKEPEENPGDNKKAAKKPLDGATEADQADTKETACGADEVEQPKSDSSVVEPFDDQLQEKLKSKSLSIKTSILEKMSALQAGNRQHADGTGTSNESSDTATREKRKPTNEVPLAQTSLPAKCRRVDNKNEKFSAIHTSSSDSEVAISDDDSMTIFKNTNDASKTVTSTSNVRKPSALTKSASSPAFGSDHAKDKDFVKKLLSGKGEQQLEQLESEVPTEADTFSSVMQGLDSIPSLMKRSKERTKKPSKPSIASSSKHSEPKPTLPTAVKAKSGLSVFETFEQELKDQPARSAAASNVSQSSDNRTDKSNGANIQQKKSEAARKVLPDMTEFMKVQVNFTLDEVTPKEVEQHHETVEPPSQMENVPNAVFRQYVRSNSSHKVLELLNTKQMYNLEYTDSTWATLIMTSTSDGSREVVRVLAHYGARVNACTKNHHTALMFAAEKDHSIIVRILLMYGAYVNFQTTSGETALMKAVKHGHLEITRCLLQAGADPCIRASDGASAMTIISRSAGPCKSLVTKHQHNVERVVAECVRTQLSQLGLRAHGSPVFGVRTYNIREHSLISLDFQCNLNNVPPNQGLMLFAVHGLICSGLSVKCRLRGPCYVGAVVINDTVMEPMMPVRGEDKYLHFMTNLTWKTGSNSLRLFLCQDAVSNEKIYLVAYQVGFSGS